MALASDTGMVICFESPPFIVNGMLPVKHGLSKPSSETLPYWAVAVYSPAAMVYGSVIWGFVPLHTVFFLASVMVSVKSAAAGRSVMSDTLLRVTSFTSCCVATANVIVPSVAVGASL